MDCSEEYTTMETILPAKRNAASMSSTMAKHTTIINKTNVNSKNKMQGNRGTKQKNKPSDKPRLKPSKRAFNQLNKYSIKSTEKKDTTSIKRNLDDNGITKQLAIDCEMVGGGVGGKKNMLARVSVVNFYGNCIYDTFVKPVKPVIDYRTFVSGVRPEDLENAPDFATVKKKVTALLKNCILVGHGLERDLAVLLLNHPYPLIRDTSKYEKFHKGKIPALKELAKKYLGVTIQEGEHSSVQDALAAMQLYKMFQKDWEDSLKRNKPKPQVKRKQVMNLQATVTRAMSLMDV